MYTLNNDQNIQENLKENIIWEMQKSEHLFRLFDRNKNDMNTLSELIVKEFIQRKKTAYDMEAFFSQL